ncbi:Hypothetical predicted protein [Olea europaea subsp. europaea]|uniref:Uncharacterized protein n=1 Tax=Olea europaea subsp. europaea TaxID=158383 RepID=A0A8S0RFF3_OLEEU|nr:Hypothetical predicted protein [Olea europaea subsp. europaea]
MFDEKNGSTDGIYRWNIRTKLEDESLVSPQPMDRMTRTLDVAPHRSFFEVGMQEFEVSKALTGEEDLPQKNASRGTGNLLEEQIVWFICHCQVRCYMGWLRKIGCFIMA